MTPRAPLLTRPCERGIGTDHCIYCGRKKKTGDQTCRVRLRAIAPPDADHFWSRVDKSGGPDACWPFTGSRDSNGYGRQQWEGRVRNASRLALLFTIGKDTERPFSCHHCDNPPCCNPKHLYWGTASDNMKDAWRRGRKKPVRGYRRDPESARRAALIGVEKRRTRAAGLVAEKREGGT